MRTVSVEVKTIYSIRFDFHDFCEVFKEAKNDPARIRAFDNFDLDDTTMGNLRDCFHSLGRLTFFLGADEARQQTDNLKYIVEKLGFDGVENYGGMFGKDKEEYRITVYNRGSDL